MEDLQSLDALAIRVIGYLRYFGERLEPGEVAHYQHMMFAQRAESLSYYLEAVSVLNRANLYQAGLSSLRSALEHHVLDVLLFLGNRYVQTINNVDESRWQEWQAARTKGEEWTKDIVSWQRTNRQVKIIRSGMHTEGSKKGPRARALSIYYFLLEEFDPLAGNARNQDYLATGFMDPEAYVSLAKRSQETYHHAIKWSALKENLRVNNILTRKNVAHLEVHYTFLSAFVHPTVAGYKMLYGHSYPSRAGTHDHYASELCWLYIISIAIAELRSLRRMSRRAPRVDLRRWDEVEQDLERADQLTSYFWFPPFGEPTEYDRIEEVNRRFIASYKRGRGEVPNPSQLKRRVVKYYRDPLRRLIRLHQSSTELTTGITYRSPWPRQDAQRRG